MIQALLAEDGVAATHRPPFVVTLIDAVHGALTLTTRTEAQRQVVLADRLLLSKTDLARPATALLADLQDLNPAAPLADATSATADDLFGDAAPIALPQRLGSLQPFKAHDGIETFVLTRQQPIPALALTMLLQALAEHCGHRLLRLKGLVCIAEAPELPAVLHGIGHVMHAPTWLEAWPSADHRSRIVLIGQGIPPWWPLRLLEAIEGEVLDAST
jgi:G3E family GTPase